MRKIDIIYTNLLSLLSKLTPTEEALSVYLDEQTEPNQSKLIGISEQISAEITQLNGAYERLEFYPDFTKTIELLDEFKTNFSDFEPFRKNELYSVITLIQKLTAEFGGIEDLNLEEEVDTEIFAIIPSQIEINQNNFFCYDPTNPTNSLFLFNIAEKVKFKNYVDSLSVESHLLYYLLSKVGAAGAPLNESKYILVNTLFAAKPKVVWATVCLHIIKAGEFVHDSFEYNTPPNISSNCKIELGKNYQQFSDSIDIISEYNFQKDILDKYLRIYHVLENFMYKSPLVNLERNSGGQVFSIRDFQRMYDKISDSELNMLMKLMGEILGLPFNATQTFNQKILADWTRLIPTHFTNATNIDHLLKILNMKTTKGVDITNAYVNATSLPKFMGKLIYAFRNSMVHNRETEFHLTHLTLTSHPVIGNTAKIILEKFLLPTIEELVFNLIIAENTVVWYDGSKLQLWEET